MDMFFAAVEMRDNPELCNIPLAVGGTGERGVVATANYIARKFGVHSAMSTRRALQLCPQLKIVGGRYEIYKSVSQQIHSVFHEYTDLVEPLSLDEAFLDVTQNKKGIALGVDVAREVKQKIFERVGLTASAGVSYCKFLAKVGSDWRKPNGLCVIHPDKAQHFIDLLPIEKFWGVGAKTAEKMHRLGIHSGYQLRQFSLTYLTGHFGKAGRMFYDFSRGIDNRPVVTEWVRKSVGCEHTLESDIRDKASVIIELYHVVMELLPRIKKHDFHGHTLTLKVKFHDFQTITRSVTRPEVLATKSKILPLAKELMMDVAHSMFSLIQPDLVR